MKKYLFLAAVVAALSIVGCSKKDVTKDTNRNVVAASDGTEAKQYQSIQATACTQWYNYQAGYCDYYHYSDSLCSVDIGCGTNQSMAISAFVDNSGKIARIAIKNYQSLPNGADVGFANLIVAGWATILHDSPISDDDLLSIVSQDYIPAGTYPIYQVGNDAIIDFVY